MLVAQVGASRRGLRAGDAQRVGGARADRVLRLTAGGVEALHVTQPSAADTIVGSGLGAA